MGFSLVAVSGSYSLLQGSGLLIAVASLIAQHGLWGTWALEVAVPGLQSTGSILVVHGLRCSVACGNLPRSGIKPVSLAFSGLILYH